MKKLIIIGIITALFVGCGGSSSSVDKAISQLEKALDKVEKNKANMTEADWEALGKEMEEPLQVINNAMDSDQVGMMGKLKVITLVAKWTAVATEFGLKQLEKETGINRENFGSEFEKAAQEIQKAAEQFAKQAAEQEPEPEQDPE